MKVAGYNDFVFINCPFDDQYTSILRAIVYTVYRCGFFPKLALTEDDGLDKIMRMIKECRYGIHDLSRIELNQAQYPRFNMPFELGIFFGARYMGAGDQRKKNALILERDKFTYQQFISDLNGIDPREHKNDPMLAMRRVRDWLRTASGRTTIPSAAIVASQYAQFKNNLPALIHELGFIEDDIPFVDYLNLVESAIQVQLS